MKIYKHEIELEWIGWPQIKDVHDDRKVNHISQEIIYYYAVWNQKTRSDWTFNNFKPMISIHQIY